VDDAFRNALMVEMGELFPKNEVFEQRGASQPRFQGVLIIGNGNTLICRQPLAA
jgi:hypothetical protein